MPTRRPEQKQRYGQAETWSGACLQAFGYGRVVCIAAAEIEGEHAPEVLEQKRVRIAPRIGSRVRAVEQQRPVVAVVFLPLHVDVGPGLLAHGFAGDVVRVRHGEEEDEEQEQHAQHGHRPIGQTADEIGGHLEALPIVGFHGGHGRRHDQQQHEVQGPAHGCVPFRAQPCPHRRLHVLVLEGRIGDAHRL